MSVTFDTRAEMDAWAIEFVRSETELANRAAALTVSPAFVAAEILSQAAGVLFRANSSHPRLPLSEQVADAATKTVTPSECGHCDGFGMCWNNADPTSGQWHPCDECKDERGHP